MFARPFCRRAAPVLSCGSRAAMPLRAKVMFPASAGVANMSSATGAIRELPGDEPEDVLFNSIYGLRTIELNRPKKLHSLNGSMCRKIYPRLQEWEKSDMANVVVIKGQGEKALCAGGDVAALAADNQTGPEGQQRSTDYFALEYKLDYLIAGYGKPFIAFMDGITMGGGVGLSVHAPFRIATERTVFAMPETTIGFFPDVGGSFFLPKLNGAIGTYLALTSERLKGVNAFYAGIATHYLHSSTLPALEARLAELRFKDYDYMRSRLDLIDATIEEFVTGLPHDQPMLLAGELRNAIDRCFGKTSVAEIIDALKAETGEMEQWAQQTLKSLHSRSPTSVHVTLRQMQLGKNWNIQETFQREHQMAGKFMAHPDFTEGVTELLVRKGKAPKWQPASLEDIAPDQDIAGPFFKVEGATPLDIEGGTWMKYPHAKYSLPTEVDVKSFIDTNSLNKARVVDHFVSVYKGKQGVRQVVEEIVSRKTTRGEDGKVAWVS